MRLRMEMTNPLLAERFKDIVGREMRAAMNREARALEKRLEAGTVAAGLSGLARTWQSKTYPSGPSIAPAGLVWSKAPQAMKAFTEGATITAKGGRFLAIPSPETRRLRGGRNQRTPSPADVERRLGVKLVFVEKAGKRFLVAPSRDRGRRRGRLFVAFFLVPRAVIRKRLDVPPLAQAALANVRIALTTAIANAQRAIGGAR
jgi:hypothetical protein